MSDFDLRKFLAEQKAPKHENVKEETINEFDPDVVAVGAPLVMSLVAAGIGKLGFDKFMQAIAKLPQLKNNKKFQDFVDKNASYFNEAHDDTKEAHDKMEEAHDKMEEGIDENVSDIIDFIMKNADKSVDWIKKNVKVGSMQQAMSSEAHDDMEEAHDDMEEAHDEMEEAHDDMEEGKEATEEEIKESTFKATINDILNS